MTHFVFLFVYSLRLDKKTKDCAVAENSARVYESRFNEINGKYNTALADRKKAEDQAKDLAAENARLLKQLDELRKQLEAETLARVDLENQNQSLREELSFKDNIHVRELTETRSRRQIEISEIDGRLNKEYEAKLQQSLQELRDQYESQMRANREEIELLYDNEIKNLQAAANRANNASAHITEEVRIMRTKIDGLNAKIQDLENTNSGLNVSIFNIPFNQKTTNTICYYRTAFVNWRVCWTANVPATTNILPLWRLNCSACAMKWLNNCKSTRISWTSKSLWIWKLLPTTSCWAVKSVVSTLPPPVLLLPTPVPAIPAIPTALICLLALAQPTAPAALRPAVVVQPLLVPAAAVVLSSAAVLSLMSLKIAILPISPSTLPPRVICKSSRPIARVALLNCTTKAPMRSI